MSDSVRGTLSWVNSDPLRSKCQGSITSAGDEHESVCKGRGRGGRRWGGFRQQCPSHICQSGGRRQRQAVCDRLSGRWKSWAEVKPKGRGSLWGQRCPRPGAGPCPVTVWGWPRTCDLGTVTRADLKVEDWRQLSALFPCSIDTWWRDRPTSSRVSGGRLSPLLWAAPPEGTLRRGSVWPRALALGRILGLKAPPPSPLISPPPSRPLCSPEAAFVSWVAKHRNRVTRKNRNPLGLWRPKVQYQHGRWSVSTLPLTACVFFFFRHSWYRMCDSRSSKRQISEQNQVCMVAS